MLPRSLPYATRHPKNGRQKKPGHFGRDDRKYYAQRATAVGSDEVGTGRRKADPSYRSQSARAGFGMTIFRLGVAKGRIRETKPPATVRGRYIPCERLMQVAANAMWRTKS